MMKKNVTGIVALLIGVALVCSFTGCNKNKKPAEVVEELEEELVEAEIVEEATDGKESSYDKLLKRDFSAFAGTWVTDTYNKIELAKDGTFEKGQKKTSAVQKNKDGSYAWTIEPDTNPHRFQLYPAGVAIEQRQSDKTKVRISFENGPVSDSAFWGPFYKPSEVVIKWNSVNVNGAVGENGKFFTSASTGIEDGPGSLDYHWVFSKDKKTWTLVDCPVPDGDYIRSSFAYGNNVFVATSWGHGQDFPPPPSFSMVAYSKDGKKWTKADCALDSNSSVDLTFNKGIFVIDATSYTRNPEESEHSSMGWASTGYTATSKDGVTWKVEKKKGQGKGGGAKVDGEEGGKKRERDSDSEGGGGKKGGGKKGGDNKDKEQAPQGQSTNPDN